MANTKPRVLVVNNYEVLSGARVGKEIQALSAACYDVRVLSWQRRSRIPVRQEVWRGVPITAVGYRPPLPTPLVAFYLPALYMRLWAGLAATAPSQFDVVHCAHPAFLPFCVWLARTQRAAVIYDVYEMFGIDFSRRFKMGSSVVRTLVESIENLFVKYVDGVVTVDSSRASLERRFRRYNPNVAVLQNVPPTGLAVADSADLPRVGHPPVLVYAGGLSIEKGLGTTLEVLEITRRSFPEIRLKLIGALEADERTRLESRARDLGLSSAVEIRG